MSGGDKQWWLAILVVAVQTFLYLGDPDIQDAIIFALTNEASHVHGTE